MTAVVRRMKPGQSILDVIAPYGQAIAFIAAVVAAFGVYLSNRHSDSQLKARNVELIRRADENAKLQEELKNQAQETTRQVTGGDAYVRLIPAFETNSGQFVVTVLQGGEASIPAFDVNIFIEPTGKCDRLPERRIRDVLSTGVNDARRHYFPAVGPGMPLPLQVNLTPSCDNAYYLAIIFTRNRVTIQQIMLKKVASEWYVSTRVLDALSGKDLWTYGAEAAEWPDLPDFVNTLRALTPTQSPLRQE